MKVCARMYLLRRKKNVTKYQLYSSLSFKIVQNDIKVFQSQYKLRKKNLWSLFCIAYYSELVNSSISLIRQCIIGLVKYLFL